MGAVQSITEAGEERALALLIGTVERLSAARTAQDVAAVVRGAARRISGADGVTFVLREGDQCHYLDEEAIGPLWKGRRFPMESCVSGWAMHHGRTAVIRDVFKDGRIPHDAYRPTFVKSLVMTPVRPADPVAAIGAYWSQVRDPSPDEVLRLGVIARATATAMENVRLIASLEAMVERRDFLLRELDHRVKNNLASMAAIAQQTLRSAPSPEAFNTSFMGRLMALSHSHELISRQDGHANLRDLLEQALAPCAGPGEARLVLSGPDVRVAAQTAMNLQMAFHELASNALSHGALSSAAGRLEVAWTVTRTPDRGEFALSWVETGGPPAQRPAQRGFGLKLIEDGLPRSVGGRAQLRFEPQGLRFELTAPLSEAIAAPGSLD